MAGARSSAPSATWSAAWARASSSRPATRRALVAAIEGTDEDLRDEAIAARRRAQGAAARCRRWSSCSRATTTPCATRAIGALRTIGDTRAVQPLTEVARFRDLADLPKVLDALALIGGDEARAYLEFVATGHDNVEIRDLAKEALGHLETRAQTSAPPAPSADALQRLWWLETQCATGGADAPALSLWTTRDSIRALCASRELPTATGPAYMALLRGFGFWFQRQT